MPIFGKVPREYLFESTQIDSSRCRPDFTHYIPDGSPARKKCGRWYPHLNTEVITATYQPDTTHFKLPFWIRWSTWFNKIWKWNINIFIRLNDKMMNRISFQFGNTFPLTIYNEPSCTSARLYTVLLYISADWDTLLYIEIRTYILQHLFLVVPINPTKFYHKMNSNN